MRSSLPTPRTSTPTNVARWSDSPGVKILATPSQAGKLTPDLVASQAHNFDNPHRRRPRVVSITQSTELGTCYSIAEVAALCEQAHDLGMTVHMDGARVANAAAALGTPLQAFTTDVGVDVLSFGGTKNGLMFGDLVVVLKPNAIRGSAGQDASAPAGAPGGVEYLRKMSMQLASKMRFISVQFEALLSGELWLTNAAHANAMARALAAAVSGIPGVEVLYPVDTNAVFARLSEEAIGRLHERKFQFYVDEPTCVARWMTAFDTTDNDVREFATAIAEAVA